MREYLKTLRKIKTWPQVTAAQKIGVSQTYYNYIEAGTRQTDMSYSMMEKLAVAFEVPVQTIIDAEADYITKLKNSA